MYTYLLMAGRKLVYLSFVPSTHPDTFQYVYIDTLYETFFFWQINNI